MAHGLPMFPICDHVRRSMILPRKPSLKSRAMEAWLAVAHQEGLPIPEPRYHATKLVATE
jgi:hypothetical protein